MNSVVQVFEHTNLPVGGAFTASRFDRLVLYNERHGNRFFDVGHKRIRFRNHVGVLHVGGLTIEILPKTDRVPDTADEKRRWQRALIGMLRQAGFIRLSSLSDARLRLHPASILEVCCEAFLDEAQNLVHQGLMRRYRQSCANANALRGRILFAPHVSRNLVHRERFFTEHVFYDRNNTFNRILRVALDILARVRITPCLASRARWLLSTSFDDVDPITVTEETFARLPYTRTTERYRRALLLARLIILNYSPDVRSGAEDVLALLFDMDQLFERFVFVQLRRAGRRRETRDITFTAQETRTFWLAERSRRSIRPDIVAHLGDGSPHNRVIIDTKWKIPREGKPSISDLHQMHTYNIQVGARHSLLVYPKTGSGQAVRGVFVQSEPPFKDVEHSCGMVFVELFDGDRLRNDLGEELISTLLAVADDRV